MKIKKVCATEILDSRGFPTVQAYVELESGVVTSAAVPSGASTGAHEALELRDGDSKRFMGKGVTKAVANVNDKINPILAGKSFDSYEAEDKAMLELDGTEAKTVLGANAVLAVSLASARAMAQDTKTPLVKLLGGGSAMPVPFMNILNGGAHAKNNIDIQEFMIVPKGASTSAEGIRWCSEVYHCLGKLLAENSLSTAVGDEGGFAPNLPSDEETLNYLSKAVEKAGYKLGSDIFFAIDAATSEWVDGNDYHLPKANKRMSHQELVEYWEGLVAKYPIMSIEDGLGEDDEQGWKLMTEKLGKKIMLVGDDLFVTNTNRLKHGIENSIANSILIKPNQIGSLSETIAAIKLAQSVDYKCVMSHRSGETSDTFISDLAVATGCQFLKAGAPARGERIAKYNRLLELEAGLYI